MTNWSHRIDTLTDWVNTNYGYPVVLDLELPVLGRVHYADEAGGPLISLNTPNAREAYLTLAHEIGHVLGHEKRPWSEFRERQALVYGWRVMVEVFTDPLVSRSEWLDWHLQPALD